MKIDKFIYLLALILPLAALAQGPPGPGPGGPLDGKITAGGGVMMRREMGKWWQDSELVKKLQLTDAQVKQLNQTFFDHRMKLIDYGAEMEKQDMKLQSLLDEDVPNENQVSAQVDQVLSARGKLERENTMMNLDLRKVLSVEQWRQLKSIREQRGPGHDVFFFRNMPPGAGPMPPPPGGGAEPF